MKIVTIIGARPQFIKAAPISEAIAKKRALGFELDEVIVHTGQHFDKNMSDIFFEELLIPKPDYNLKINGGSHGEMTSKMIKGIEDILIFEKPDIVLVYGDTNSTLAGAISVVKLHIKIAHVEAGLRSFNLKMPEEINRILTDRISSFLFTPTETATNNLVKEGVDTRIIHQVGDVMYDIVKKIRGNLGFKNNILEKYGLIKNKYILATLHRAENVDDLDTLRIVVEAFLIVSDEFVVVWPLHPRTKEKLILLGLLEKVSKSIILIDPVGYLDMLVLEENSALIATDSGGIQKEAYFFKVPCVTLRNETEWVELLHSGWNCLAPPISTEFIVDKIKSSMNTSGDGSFLYGKGDAADLIISKLI